LNLAVTAELLGERVVVVDLDPQGTAASWHKARKSETPVLIEHTKAGSLDETLRRLSARGFSLALIDTAGTDSVVTHSAMRAADLCLVPVRPSEADVRATMPTVRALSAMGRPYALVVNQAPARLVAKVPLRLVADGPVLPVVIAARVDHQYAYALGQGVQEFAPEGKATAEIIELWQAVRIRMGLMEATSGNPIGFDTTSRRANPVRSDGPSSRPLAVGPRPCG
jgi:chromosome partitioning protein